MESFSERFGYVPERIMQSESMDERLRNRIANCLHEHTPLADDYLGLQQVIDDEFARFFIDEMGLKWKGRSSDIESVIDRVADDGAWHEVYSMVERFGYSLEEGDVDSFASSITDLLKEEKAGYRVLVVGTNDKQCLIVPITNEFELGEVEAASQTEVDAVSCHIEAAVKRFADRKNPDNANAVKEAISAVESIMCLMDGKAKTLGDAIKRARKEGAPINPRLLDGLEKLYAYASETVRHGTSEPVEVTSSEAKLMIVMCSAIANYLLSEYEGQER